MNNTSTNDGGPAFPHENKEFDAAYGAHFPSNSESGHGMSLRDWFAGMALSGYAGRATMTARDTLDQCDDGVFYKMADAMLAARERKEQP